MPELPEVETTAKGLRKTIVGLRIKDVWTDLHTKDKRKGDTVAYPLYFPRFKKEVVGKKVLSVKRRGKNILINLSGNKTMLVHMKMTGHLLYGKYTLRDSSWTAKDPGPLRDDPFNKFLHVVFTLSDKKHVAFSDMRKFGKITLLDTGTAHTSRHLEHIGPEPLEKKFILPKLEEALAKKPNGKIKTTLMDQTVIAGIGNIYSDEILWRAGVHPERKAKDLTRNELGLILTAIKEVLAKGINFGGDSMSDYRNIQGLPGKFQIKHEAYRRTGEKCRKKNCKGIIQRKVVNSRSAHFCNAHQK